MTKSSQNPMQTMSMTFNEATWEHIEVADDTLAMFTAKGADKLLILKYRTAESKVISMELKEDIGKEDLVKLAKTYVGE